jgi:hypothetical protein
MQEAAIEALKKLHTAAIDARNGYQEALDDAKGQGLSGLFAEMVDLHAKAVGVPVLLQFRIMRRSVNCAPWLFVLLYR